MVDNVVEELCILGSGSGRLDPFLARRLGLLIRILVAMADISYSIGSLIGDLPSCRP